MALIVVGSMKWLGVALLALPPAALLADALRVRARRPAPVAPVAPVAPSDVEVERSVRDRLYGERTIETVRDR